MWQGKTEQAQKEPVDHGQDWSLQATGRQARNGRTVLQHSTGKGWEINSRLLVLRFKSVLTLQTHPRSWRTLVISSMCRPTLYRWVGLSVCR